MLSLLLAAVLAVPALAADSRKESMDFGGHKRVWLVREPAGAKKARPLVLVLHGGGGSAANGERMSGFSDLSEREDVLVVYPEGTGRLPLKTWNAGNCCGYAERENVDDVGFLTALIARLVKEGRADPKRVYATGMSNGGMMTHRLACERADLLAAIAPVAGTIAVKDCKPSRGVPVLIVHGRKDEHVPYAGGEGSKAVSKGRHDRSVEEVAALWRAAGSKVELLIHDGGHIWPGGKPGRRFGNVDPVLPEPKATEKMWAYFKARSLP